MLQVILYWKVTIPLQNALKYDDLETKMYDFFKGYFTKLILLWGIFIALK